MLDRASSSAPRSAISADDKPVVDKSIGDISVADDERWFAVLAQALLPSKPGTALHYATGFEERSCQRYAAGSVQPPGYFIRSLLRCPDGAIWLAALMEGCTAQWWLDHQRSVRLVAAAERFQQEINRS